MDYQTILNTLTTEHTTESYNGRTGCMCGCLGNYKTSQRSRSIALNKIKNASLETSYYIDFCDLKDMGIGAITVYNNNDRQSTVYLNKEGIDIARKAFEGSKGNKIFFNKI